MQPHSRTRFCAALFLLGAAFFLSQSLCAQTLEAAEPSAAAPSFLRYGLFGGVTVNNHFANFSEFSGYSNIVGYPFGNTGNLSYYVGGLVEVPIINRFGVALRASVANVGGFMLSVRENILSWSAT